MNLKKAVMDDFYDIRNTYIDIIDNTADMEKYTRWIWGMHPTDEMITKYIRNGAMYKYMLKDEIAGVLAVTMEQEKDYHQVSWEINIKDSQVSVIHILGVVPKYQRLGIGRKMIDEALELARINGKKAVRLDALVSNTPAQHMYQEKGFTYRGSKNQYAENTGWIDFYFYEYIL